MLGEPWREPLKRSAPGQLLWSPMPHVAPRTAGYARFLRFMADLTGVLEKAT